MKQKKQKKQKEKFSQYTNVIGIDPSTTCTGICIDGKLTAVSTDDLAYTKSGKLKKWFDISTQEASIKTIPSRQPHDDYSGEEMSKLEFYMAFSDLVVNTVLDAGTRPKYTLVVMEGFSYASAAGNLIDLVTFSTLIRSSLYQKGYQLKIVSPSTLKLCTAKMCYKPKTEYLNKKKTRSKTVWKNNDDLSGGNFKKPDMLTAIIEGTALHDRWKMFLQEHYSDLRALKSVPKPIEDLNDAYLLYNVHKKGFGE